MLHLVRVWGGKHFLVKKLLRLIPPHKCYVEVFGGGASLLLNKPRSDVEIYNDIDGELVNLFRVVRERPTELQKRAEFMLYSHEEFERFVAEKPPDDPVERALRTLYVTLASRTSTSRPHWRQSGCTMRNHAKDFFNKIDKLRLISYRLRNVAIESVDFRECLRLYDSPHTFFFLDPPYFGTPQSSYSTEFLDKDHYDLAQILRKVKGRWMLIHKDHPIIRMFYSDYEPIEMTTPRCLAVARNRLMPPNKYLVYVNY